MKSETKQCQNCKKDFTIELDDFGFYEKMKVPPPTFCPECRKQRRLTWRNDMTLYNRICDLCKKNIISIYSPESDLTVYCVKCWWSDKWDPKSYAVEYDFSRPFFEQYRDLRRKVPILALMNDNGLIGGSLNCEYNQDFARSKNCYMIFVAWKLEDCMYGHYLVSGRQMVDCLSILEGNNLIYESIFTANSYKSKYIYNSVSVLDSAFLFDCRDCNNCLMCAGLRGQKYCFKNNKYSKEEYKKILTEYKLDTFSGTEKAKNDFLNFLNENPKPRRFSNERNCILSYGDYLNNSKNCRNCFLVHNGENCRYTDSQDTPKDCYDLSTGGELQYAYEGITPDHTYMGRFAIFSWKNTEYYYADGCHSCENIFGCVGLKKAKYSILNKQYTKEEYEKLLPEIKKHMDNMPYVDKKGRVYRFGEFFPAELSYFGYNETTAQDLLPLTKEEALKRGFNWRDKLQFTTGKGTLKLEEIPDLITQVSDSILNEILSCIDCDRNYKITLAELKFYRQMNIPIPRRCFYCRHKDRVNFRNPFKLWHRTCACAGARSSNEVYKNTKDHFHGAGKCEVEFETSYAPERPEIVYCERCYQQEVY